jgi:hypothetical protein
MIWRLGAVRSSDAGLEAEDPALSNSCSIAPKMVSCPAMDWFRGRPDAGAVR